jgi:hypothetical protein
VTTYFRLHPSEEDPGDLLRPDHQTSKPWGDADHGPCDKCRQTGRTTYRCESCKADAADPHCEFCSGRVEFEADCPTCKGSGEISDSERDGVSVFPDADGLYRYMLRRDADMRGQTLVELEGRKADDVDFDADEGALLVHPTRIVRSSRVDEERIGELRREVAA